MVVVMKISWHLVKHSFMKISDLLLIRWENQVFKYGGPEPNTQHTGMEGLGWLGNQKSWLIPELSDTVWYQTEICNVSQTRWWRKRYWSRTIRYEWYGQFHWVLLKKTELQNWKNYKPRMRNLHLLYVKISESFLQYQQIFLQFATCQHQKCSSTVVTLHLEVLELELSVKKAVQIGDWISEDVKRGGNRWFLCRGEWCR